MTDSTPLLTLHAPRLFYTGADRSISLPDGDVDIPRGVSVMIGPNGAGKSTLAGIIERGWNFRTNRISAPSSRKPSVRHIEFADIHALSGFKVGYYQQRYEASMNDDVPTVSSLLGSRIDCDEWRRLASLLHLEGAPAKRVNFLSSGELRKLLIANLLFEHPDLLILDNPYIGLDAPSRAILDDTIRAIAASGTSVLMILADTADVPSFATSVIRVEGLAVYPPQPLSPSLLDSIAASMRSFSIPHSLIPPPPEPDGHDDAPLDPSLPMISMHHCRVAYGASTIISDISWDILPGQRWMLSGPNGSGKSTLLSLICADNPQRYVNDITAFGHHRRSGESIWDIKRHIGYISPEMHLHFHGSGDVATIVAQGLNDTVGLFVRVRPPQLQLAMQWLKLLGLDHLASSRFDDLSAGQQRLVLLARTLIKQPRLLILDEPLHGLDMGRRQAVRSLISAIMARHPLSSLIFVTHYPESELPDCITHSLSLSPN